MQLQRSGARRLTELLAVLLRQWPLSGVLAGVEDEPLTPPDSTSALITFGVKDSAPVLERLRQKNLHVRVGRNFLRVSPSVFNDMGDIHRLLEALA